MIMHCVQFGPATLYLLFLTKFATFVAYSKGLTNAFNKNTTHTCTCNCASFPSRIHFKFYVLCINGILQMLLFICRTHRLCTKSADIGGFIVPEGTGIIVPIMVLHHDKNIWDEPEKFRPER